MLITLLFVNNTINSIIGTIASVILRKAMKKTASQYYLLNYLFLVGLLLLVLNDHFLKYEYGNWLTGKLSDFAGLLILPFFLAFIFPKKAKYMTILSGIFFVFWKSPLSESAIQFYNYFAMIPIIRVVDYTDLIALSVLPLAHRFLLHAEHFNKIIIPRFRFSSSLIFIFTCFAFMATSPPLNYWFQLHDAEVKVKEKYLVELKEQEILAVLGREGFIVEKDTFISEFYSVHYIEQKIRQHPPFYKIEPIIVDGDTFPKVQFAIDSIYQRESWIYLNGIELPANTSKKVARKKIRRYYRDLFRSSIIND